MTRPLDSYRAEGNPLMRRSTPGYLLAAVLAAGTGCSVQPEPEQPKLTDEQIKDLMKQGAEQRERGDPRHGMGPSKPRPG